MRTLFAALGLIFFSFSAQADSWSCMSMEEADKLINALRREQYLVDYCDCCDEDAEYPNENNASLFEFLDFDLVTCPHDEERFSVKMHVKILGVWYIEQDGKFGDLISSVEKETYLFANFNYQFFLKDLRAHRLQYLVSDDAIDPGCWGIWSFPSSAWLKNEKYKAWYSNK